MTDIHDKIKIVIWDLDDTLWRGTLAEGDDVEPIKAAVDLVSELDRRGIVSAVCSKNDPGAAMRKLESLGLDGLFVDFAISFANKGPVIRRLLSSLHLRAENALFVDDNPTNLKEAQFFNKGLNVAGADGIGGLAGHECLAGKPDPGLSRHARYVQLVAKRKARSSYDDDDSFLRDLGIRVRFIKVGESNIDRVHELSERTNQLNFTKDRSSREELLRLSRDVTVDMKCVRVMDKFGDDGIVGFYALRDGKLLHFVFSCRILGMRVEQWLWQHLGCPALDVRGNVAAGLSEDAPAIDFVTIDGGGDEMDTDSAFSVDTYVRDGDRLRVIGIGACDLFGAIANIAMHGSYLRYECNVFHGQERGVNTGTEYLRSCFDMTDDQKAYCRSTFMNYAGDLAFNTQLVSGKFDYVILSFHDDIVYQTFRSRTDAGLRVVRTDMPTSGTTSLIGGVSGDSFVRMPDDAAAAYMNGHFMPGESISRDRFRENILYLMGLCGDRTRFVLMGAPEIGFYWDKMPEAGYVFDQARMVNSVIREIAAAMPDRCAAVDLTRIIRSRDDVRDYLFHFKAVQGYKITMEILRAMAGLRFSDRPGLLSGLPVNGRDLVIIGPASEAGKAYLNLKIMNEDPAGLFYDRDVGAASEGGLSCKPVSELDGMRDRYYVIIADSRRHGEMEDLLSRYGYESVKDWIRFDPLVYGRVWTDTQVMPM